MTDIYESPGSGEGKSEHTLRSTKHSDLYIKMKEDQLWGNIRRAAKTNVALADALDQVKMIYALIKK